MCRQSLLNQCFTCFPLPHATGCYEDEVLSYHIRPFLCHQSSLKSAKHAIPLFYCLLNMFYYILCVSASRLYNKLSIVQSKLCNTIIAHRTLPSLWPLYLHLHLNSKPLYCKLLSGRTWHASKINHSN